MTEAFDVTARTLRYYEEVGLLRPARSGVQRVYSERDRVRMGLILRGRRLGFSLQDIEEMLSLYDVDDTEVAQLRDVIQRGDARLSEVEAQIRDLSALRDELAELRANMQQLLEERLKSGRGD